MSAEYSEMNARTGYILSSNVKRFRENNVFVVLFLFMVIAVKQIESKTAKKRRQINWRGAVNFKKQRKM